MEDYAIYVGGKPFMNYVTAVVMQFTTKGADKVVIKARGKFISRAVDVAEVVKSRFLRDQVAVEGMEMDSEEFTNKEGKQVRVSTLDITLGRVESKPAPEPAPKAEKPKKEEPAEEETPAEETEEAEKEAK